MFTGAHRVRVDEKGRLAVPAAYRKQLPEGSFVSVSQEQVLAIYPPDLWEALAQELRSPLPGPDQRAVSRTLYSNSAALLRRVRSAKLANEVPAAVELIKVLRLIRDFIGTSPPDCNRFAHLQPLVPAKAGTQFFAPGFPLSRE